MLTLLIVTYILVHQYINLKFARGYLGKRYAIYTLSIALLTLILFLLIKIHIGDNDITATLLFIIFLLIYNLIFAAIKANWHFTFRSNKSLNEDYLIYGTGKISRKIFSLLADEVNTNILGYISNDEAYTNKFINNIKCVCNLKTLENYAKRRRLGIVVPIDVISSDERLKLVEISRKLNLRFIPIRSDFDINLKSLKSQKIPELTPGDILKSKSGPFNEMEKEKFRNKVVLVVGGAGSIGGAIIEQLLKMNVKRIICYDISEASVYRISEKIRKSQLDLAGLLDFRIGCIGDEGTISELIDQGVQIVINAAAYKHVPICERNIDACLLNNVIKTHSLLKVVVKKKVELFIQISTDKAVRPTNVMGVSKRIAELLIIYLQSKSVHTKFHVVRFGNVLGSSGSVFHLFVDQIKSGGPLTVTHPDITRYLMTIEDAARLVLKSVSLDQAFSINFLDMGQPVKISDLADRMIVAHGRMVSNGDEKEIGSLMIEKIFTGLRPGEKLYEELSHENNAVKTSIDGVLSVEIGAENYLSLDKIMTEIDRAIACSDASEKKNFLKEIVTDYVLE